MNDTLSDTPMARLDFALRTARKQGVAVRKNLRQCCNGCITPEQLGLTEETADTAPYVYIFGGQGQAIYEQDGKIVYRTGSRPYWDGRYRVEEAKHVYIHHGNGGGSIIRDLLVAEGFDIDWDGSEHYSVTINLQEQS